jgi:hypothetical protein
MPRPLTDFQITSRGPPLDDAAALHGPTSATDSRLSTSASCVLISDFFTARKDIPLDDAALHGERREWRQRPQSEWTRDGIKHAETKGGLAPVKSGDTNASRKDEVVEEYERANSLNADIPLSLILTSFQRLKSQDVHPGWMTLRKDPRAEGAGPMMSRCVQQ